MERQALIKKMTFKKLTEQTIDNEEVLKIKEFGYALSRGEQDKETVGISNPIYKNKCRNGLEFDKNKVTNLDVAVDVKTPF